MGVLYYSTRGDKQAYTASQAILQGLAKDGGLFVPDALPKLDKTMEELSAMDYKEVAYEVMKQFLTDYTKEELKTCIKNAYNDRFDTPAIAPTVKKAGAYYLELFHGPTIAFKDIFTTDQDCSVEKKEVLKEYLSRHSIVSVCGKMVKCTCIDVDKDYEKFGRISTGEDTLQSIEFFSNAKTFVYLNHVIYDYRCGSGMTGKFDENYYFTFKRIFEEIEKKKDNWELADFDKLFAVKILQTAGRAITQSRYKKWESMWEQTRYLKQIREDKMFQKNILYLATIKGKLQKDHAMLLKLLQNRRYILICLMLSVKNYLAGNKGE